MSKFIKAVAFPGQGIQRPGMALNVRNTPVWDYFETASTILGYDLGRLCLEGPEDILNDTSQAQVAIFVTCFALWELVKSKIEVQVFLGHSLGEITAFAAAGAFSFATGVKLTKIRGELMSKGPKGAMIAVLGLDAGQVHELCFQASSKGNCQVANLNSPAQIVVSGDPKGLEYFSSLAKECGAKRIIRLNVSGPFHSKLMGSVAERFAEEVEHFDIRPLHTPVLSNDGETLVYQAHQVKEKIVKQITEPVYFTNQVKTLVQLGIREFVELSPESLLIPLARRTSANLQFILVRNGGMM